jgi:hypothetical protein
MASSKHPHQMPLAEYVEWARSKIVAPDGRISRAGVAEVRRDLVSRVGYLRRTDDERTMQEFIKRLDPNMDLTTEGLSELETMATTAVESATSASETITQEGNEMAEAANAPQSPGLENVRGMNAIASTTEGRIALQRARNGQDLTPQQQRLVDDYRALEKAHNESAKPTYSGGTFSTKRPHYVSPELYRIEAIKDPRERAHAIRALRSEWRDNPKSPFNDVNHGDHKTAVENMSRLYRAEAELPQPEDENR